jgi:hypothetical protein
MSKEKTKKVTKKEPKKEPKYQVELECNEEIKTSTGDNLASLVEKIELPQMITTVVTLRVKTKSGEEERMMAGKVARRVLGDEVSREILTNQLTENLD